jgi:transposase
MALAAVGAQIRFLPPYSPDFNPIELAFAKLKSISAGGATAQLRPGRRARREPVG